MTRRLFAPVADSGEPVLAEAELPVETPAPMYYLVDDDERSGREWYSRATDLYNNRRFERAGQAYENAASRGYKTGTAYYNAGCSYALADQKGRAIDALKESVNEGFDRPDLFAEDSDLNSLRGDLPVNDV